jgi:hypothetical protein
MKQVSEENSIADRMHVDRTDGSSLRRVAAWLLDPPPETPRWGVPEFVAIVAWVVLAAFAVWQHVPWADEMQAWFLASGVDWHTLLFHSLRYEGTGGLWHSFLKLCQAAHLSFFAARYLAAAVQAAAMVVLLRDAPLPRAVRLLLPFTFFLLYQDAVVARSYCLLAVFAFLAARLLRSGRPRPVYLALLLGLMANISVHGAFLSGGLAVVAAVIWGRRLLRNPSAIALLLCLWTAACIAMAPAYDIDYEAGNNLRRSFAKAEQSLGIDAAPPPRLVGLPEYGLPQAPPLVHRRDRSHAFRHRVERLLAVINYPLSSLRAAALLLAALLTLMAFMQSRRHIPEKVAGRSAGPLGLLPWGLMVLIFSSLFLAPRHAGTVFTGFIVSAWLVWPQAQILSVRQRWFARFTAGLWCLLCLQSIAWSAHALVEEHHIAYSPGRMTAEFLKANGVGQPASNKTVAGFYYFSIDALLYFNHNIYINQPPHRYWFWSTSMIRYRTAEQTLARHPDFIVVGGFELGPENEITRDWFPPDTGPAGIVMNDDARIVSYFEAHGYRLTHVFCGRGWMRGSYGEKLCNRILEPDRSEPDQSEPNQSEPNQSEPRQ